MIALFTLTSRTVSWRWFQVRLFRLLIRVMGSAITGYQDLVDSYAELILAGGRWWAGSAVDDRPGRRGIVNFSAKRM